MPAVYDRYTKKQKDPGNAGSIKPIYASTHVGLVSTAAETRTLARPFKVGIIATLAMKTDGGDITVTVTGGFDEIGSTTLVFSDVGQFATFMAVDVSGTPTWRVVRSNNLGQLSPTVAIADAATYTVLAANSGKVHVLPDLTASITITLPAVVNGLAYTFITKAVAADAQNWVFDTGAAANFYLGGLAFADTDAGAGADEIHAGVWPNGSSNDIMTIVTPGAGTRIELICDGTNWIVNGVVYSATVPTFADT